MQKIQLQIQITREHISIYKIETKELGQLEILVYTLIDKPLKSEKFQGVECSSCCNCYRSAAYINNRFHDLVVVITGEN